MAETLIKSEVCAACGADVRKGALFCYHCGGSLASEVEVSSANGSSVSTGWFRENIVAEQEESIKPTSKLNDTISERSDKPIEKPVDVPRGTPIEKPSDEPFKVEKPKNEEKKLKSAAAMRRKAKIVQKKSVEEIIWEEHENAPNGWFMLVALVLILIAVGIYYLAIYIK